MHRRAAFLLLFASLTLPCPAAVSHGFRVPDGFEVSLYAGDDLAHDIFSMTTAAKGRIAVAGKDYVKILHDTDGDGKADKLFVKVSKSGAHGMYFDGPDYPTATAASAAGATDGDGRWRAGVLARTERDGEHRSTAS